MRILILGGSGMLGHKLLQAWQERFDVWTTVKNKFSDYGHYEIFDRKKTFELVDAEQPQNIGEVIKKIRPAVIFNAIGIIKQLPSSKNVIKTLTINSILPHRLAEMAEKYDARLINISTDCVFNGKKGNYTEEDPPDAEDVYGKSKNLGEVTGENCLTLRTSIIGRELRTNHSLVEWFLSNRAKQVRGFVNAIYTGFPTIILADIISDLLENHPRLSGLYHLSSEPVNKFELLNLIKAAYKIEIEIEPFEDFRVDRSLDSTKFRQATGFQPLSWPEMIRRMAADPTPYEAWRNPEGRNK
jgi:dTDP-4-dehydrorhamnose reductase